MHSLFLAALDDIIENKIDSSAALANLKTSQLKAVHGKVLQRKKELKGIRSGELTGAGVQNL